MNGDLGNSNYTKILQKLEIGLKGYGMKINVGIIKVIRVNDEKDMSVEIPERRIEHLTTG